MITAPDGDRIGADRERDARDRLLAAGASDLPRAPWLHRSQPPSAVDLVRFAVWQAQSGDETDDDVEAALALLPATRAEVQHLETAALFTARARGMSWARIARAMGLGSAQAAQQRFDRLSGRVASRTKY